MIKVLIEIVNLTIYSVTIKKQRVYIEGDVTSNLGEPECISYINESVSRADMVANVEEPYKSAILAVWGTKTTIKSKPVEIPKES